MPIECSISNYTFPFTKNRDEFQNNIVTGKYEFDQTIGKRNYS